MPYCMESTYIYTKTDSKNTVTSQYQTPSQTFSWVKTSTSKHTSMIGPNMSLSLSMRIMTEFKVSVLVINFILIT